MIESNSNISKDEFEEYQRAIAKNYILHKDFATISKVTKIPVEKIKFMDDNYDSLCDKYGKIRLKKEKDPIYKFK
jgi:hypothetical protein